MRSVLQSHGGPIRTIQTRSVPYRPPFKRNRKGAVRAAPADDSGTFEGIGDLLRSSLQESVAPGPTTPPSASPTSPGPDPLAPSAASDAAAGKIPPTPTSPSEASSAIKSTVEKAAEAPSTVKSTLEKATEAPSAIKSAAERAAEAPSAVKGTAEKAAESSSAIRGTVEKATEAPSTVKDTVKDTAKKATEALSKSAPEPSAPTPVPAPAPAPAPSPSLPSGSESADQASKALSKAAPDTGRQALQEAGKAVSETVPQPSAASQPPAEAGGIGDSVSSSLDNLTTSFSDAKDSLLDKASEVTGGASKSLQDLTGDFGKQLDNISDGLGKQFGDATGSAGDSLQGVGAQLDAAREAAAASASDLSAQISQSASSALEALPEPVRDAVNAASGPLTKALSNPSIALPALGVGASLPIYLWVTSRLGYAGQLPAEEADDMLELEDSLLLDVRDERSREASGTPDLRYDARTRGIALPLSQLSRRSYSQVTKADDLPFQITALLVEDLVKVNRKTKIIVLDDNSSRSIKVARAIAERGYRAYVLQGGFRAWRSAGLPVKAAPNYDASDLDVLSDKIQGQVIPSLRDPVLGSLAVSLGITTLAALIDWRKTLQFVGAFGVLTTLGTVPIRYNSLEEAKEDLLGPFLRVAGVALGVVGFFSRFLPKNETAGASAEGRLAEPMEEDDPYAELEKESKLEEESVREKENNSAKTNA